MKGFIFGIFMLWVLGVGWWYLVGQGNKVLTVEGGIAICLALMCGTIVGAIMNN